MPLLPMGPPQGGGLATPAGPAPGMPMQGGLPPMPPPVPAAMAGQAAAALVPVQMQQQQQLAQQQGQETIAALMSVFQSAANPAAEGIGGMPAPMIASGPPPGGDPNAPDQGY